ncbi:protein bunched, class 2/F/G isoform isoform X2 [Lutzomyia longipalpis]|uniref:protein bunched, class 2/F/G isoform isoform X2 n=1 Tax=Lutzomyia longipalpis TaxID=7200 RepID=UPI002483335D|nr:protein bunched, class 2/F/G isoform isoform X2 [Lutzomyia longipalpis]
MLKMADTASGPVKQQKQHGVPKGHPEAAKVEPLPGRRINDGGGTKGMSTDGRGGQTTTNTGGAAPSLGRKPKASSFQITSVTVGTRTSADNGEDSADDLDESHSHTDDNSRVTDHGNETPSFSEDTSFSKEDVFYSSNALGTAPVIPTSSQYGLAIVSPELNGTATLTDVHVSLTDAGINIVGNAKQNCDVDKEGHQRNERFKVVKIESTEPFKRGRWMCMDYLDHTTLQQTTTSSEGALDGTDDTAAKVNNILPGQTAPAVFYNSTAAPVPATDALPEVTTTAPVVATTTASNYTAQSMPSHQMQEVIASASKRPPKMTTMPRHQGQTQPAQYYKQALSSGQRHTSTQEYTQGATLPANLNFHDTAGLEASLASLSHSISGQQQHHSTSPKVRRSDEARSVATAELPSSQHHPEVEKVKEGVADEPPIACDRVVATEVVDSNCVSTSSGVNSPTVSVVSPEMTPDVATEVEMSPEQQHLGGATPANPDETTPNDESESASGTSAVAIDNKIEQAMDLVKSHLMFAVREEVEVLKEKIAELMDRINQLEVENTILKANATQETLSQLSATLASGKVQASNTGNGSAS